jgi:hypothetical protein
MKPQFFYLPLLLLFAVLISACGEGSVDTETRIYVKGVATADAPLKDSTVNIYDIYENLAASSLHGTQENGTFLVSVPRYLLSEGYIIVVTGGKNAYTEEDSTYTMRAYVGEDTMNADGIIHVSPLSTLLAEYMAQNNLTDHSAAERTVAEFFSIPETQKLLTDIYFHDGDFSESVFLAQAEANGGLDAYISILLGQLNSQGEPLSFAGEEMPQGVGGAFAMGLIQGAGSQIGSRATGWVLDSVFGESDTPSYPTDPALISAIEQNSMEIHQLRDELEQFEKKISAALQQILTQTQRNEYTILVSALLDDIARIETQHNNLWFITNHLNMPEDTDWENTVKDFQRKLDIDALEVSMRKFQRVLAGSADTSSAIELWGKIHTTYAITQQNHQPLFDQFQMYANLQLMTLNLILEKRHSSNSGKTPEYFVDLYLTGLEQQSDMFLRKVLSVMAVSVNHTMSDNAHPYDYTDWHAYEINVFALLATDSRESAVLAEADTITAEAMAVEQSLTIRLVDYMWHESPKNPSWIQNVPVTLINVDSGLEYAADVIHRDREIMPETGHEIYGWGHQFWDFNRYVFTSLPEGNYMLKNINDQFPNPYGHGSAIYHSDYLSKQIVMQAGRHGNFLMGAFPSTHDPVVPK